MQYALGFITGFVALLAGLILLSMWRKEKEQTVRKKQERIFADRQNISNFQILFADPIEFRSEEQAQSAIAEIREAIRKYGYVLVSRLLNMSHRDSTIGDDYCMVPTDLNYPESDFYIVHDRVTQKWYLYCYGLIERIEKEKA